MLAIEGAKIFTLGPAGTIDAGTVLIEGEKIKAVGGRLEVPAGTRIVRAAGLTMVPGFVDAHSHLGLTSQGLGIDDATEATEQVSPQLRALDALDPVSPSLRISLENGVTTTGLLPGASMSFGAVTENITVMPGMASVLKVRATYPEVLRARAGLKMALGDQPKRAVAEKKTAPATRMNIISLIRENLMAAQAYMKKREKGEGDFDAKKEALAGLLRREYPALVHAHRVRDIRAAVALAEEFGFDVVIEHATEGYLIADELARKGVPCAVGPISFARRGPELSGLSLENPARLAAAGVKVAIISDFPTFPAHYLPIHAGMAHREGMPYEEALKAVTINAAEILGVADRVGSLEPGKSADLVLFAGDPLGAMSRVRMVVSSGEIVYDEAGAGSGAGAAEGRSN